MGLAAKIDIESELAAMERGECSGCRVGFTHKRSAACAFTPDPAQGFVECQCGTRYVPGHLRGAYEGKVCPDCLDARSGRK